MALSRQLASRLSYAGARVFARALRPVGPAVAGGLEGDAGSSRRWAVAAAVAAGLGFGVAVAEPSGDKSRSEAYSWGWGQYGQLGHGTEKDETGPRVIKLLAGKGLVQLASGPTATSSAAVTATGEVYTFGCGGDGRLGHGQIESGYVPNQDVPKHVDRLGMLVRKVAVGEYHMAALGVDGSVRTWGKSRAGQLGHDNAAKGLPSPVLGLESVRIVDVGCGRQHTVAVAEDGRVFSWGAGSMGALGLGSKADQSRPQVVGGGGLGDARVVAVSCGRDFTLLLTSDGKVYGFGSDENGQLGTGFAARSHTLPVLVWDAAEARAARVLAGASHTVIITEGGQVYSFGANKDGQLGHGDRNDVGTPRLIESLRDRRIVDGAAGNAHTLLVDDKGELLAFGRGRYGQLGRADHLESVAAYRLEPVPVDALRGKRVVGVGAGSEHSLVIVA